MSQSSTISRLPAKALPRSLDRLNPVVVDDLVRLGVNMDGGYVVPRSAVLDADALVSFGLGDDWSFEQDALRLNPRLIVHVYDHSVGERKFIDGIASCWRSFMGHQGSMRPAHAAFALSEIRALVELYESYRKFFLGKVCHFQSRVSDRVESFRDITPEQVFVRLGEKQKLLLKMDIEIGEYQILEDLLDYEKRIRLMVIEFHATEFIRDMFLEKIERIIQHYEVVHIHGNNYAGLANDGLPSLLEITFLHKSLCRASPRRGRLPVPGLDFPNNPKKVDHELLFADAVSEPVPMSLMLAAEGCNAPAVLRARGTQSRICEAELSAPGRATDSALAPADTGGNGA